MTLRKHRPILLVLATLALSLTLAALGAVPAEARTVSHPSVGVIEVEYFVAAQDYDGFFRPAHPDDCVKVQRKAGGVWRDNVSTNNGYNCTHTALLSWWIYDNTLAQNTTAIRLIVITGPNDGSYLVACTSTTDCQQT